MGGMTILFNNAGIGGLSPLHEWEPEEWNRLVSVNLTGVYLGFRAAVPHLRASRWREHRLHRLHQRHPAGGRGGALRRGQGRRGRHHRLGGPRVRPGHPGQRGVARG